MKSFISIVMVLALVFSLGVLGACNGGNDNNNNNNSSNNDSSNSNDNNNNNNNDPVVQASSRTVVETIQLFEQGRNTDDRTILADVLYKGATHDFTVEGYTFVKTAITIQNPDAQMEPYEVDHYKEILPDLRDTAIVCVMEVTTYKINATGETKDYTYYYDYYLVTTESHPDWFIMGWAPQAGQ
jgi:hypothetical protein